VNPKLELSFRDVLLEIINRGYRVEISSDEFVLKYGDASRWISTDPRLDVGFLLDIFLDFQKDLAFDGVLKR